MYVLNLNKMWNVCTKLQKRLQCQRTGIGRHLYIAYSFSISSITSGFFSILITYRLFFFNCTKILSIKNWLFSSSILMKPVSSFTFDECLIFIFSAFKDSIQLLNLLSRYSEILFVTKSYFSVCSRDNAGKNRFICLWKLW